MTSEKHPTHTEQGGVLYSQLRRSAELIGKAALFGFAALTAVGMLLEMPYDNDDIGVHPFDSDLG